MGVYTFAQQNYFVSFLMVVLGWLSDYYDGKLARYLNVHSRFGKWLDHIADRFSLTCVVYAFYPLFPYSVIALFVPGVVISFIHAMYAVKFNKEMRGKWAEKLWLFIATFIFPICVIIDYVYFGGSSLGMLYVAIISVGVLFGVTAIVQYVNKYRRKMLKLKPTS